VIDESGAGVTQWRRGQRVGVGWHGGQDGSCLACRRGDFANLKITGLSYDGGYQRYMIAPVGAVARMPESLDAAEAAPPMCAGIATFNALRHSGAVPSGLVAVQGVGGLGHLGIQFAQKCGYRVSAIGRGPGNAALAKKLKASVHRQRRVERSGRVAETRWGARDPGDCAQLESDVVADRRTGEEWKDDGGGSDGGSDRGDACSVDVWHAEIGNPDRFGGYSAVCRAARRATDDREVSAG
jgi:NADPH:quinone reductase-like Zn-dependent oxidoreductase